MSLSKYQKLTLEIYNLSTKLTCCHDEEWDSVKQEFDKAVNKFNKFYDKELVDENLGEHNECK